MIAATPLSKHLLGFAIGSVLGTGFFFMNTGKTVFLDNNDGKTSRFKWQHGPNEVCRVTGCKAAFSPKPARFST